MDLPELTKPKVDPEIGLSSLYVKQKLIEEIESFLQSHSPHHNFKIRNIWTSPLFVLTVLSSLLLLIYFILVDTWANQEKWIMKESLLIESIIIFCLLIWNIFILKREYRVQEEEPIRELKHILRLLKKYGISVIQDIKLPQVPSISLVKVIRDGVVRWLPSTLLIENDVIELSIGELAPCPIQLLSPIGVPELNYQLETGKLFHFSTTFDYNQYRFQTSGFRFVVLKTPIQKSLRSIYQTNRPKTILMQQFEKIYGALCKFTLISLSLSFLLSLIKFLTFLDSNQRSFAWFGLLIIQQVYVVLPVLPLLNITLWIVSRAFANTKIIILFEKLQQSTTPFDDQADVDEFDADAPAPTKLIKVTNSFIFKRFVSLLTTTGKGKYYNVHLLETLSTVTVICSIDREASITSHYPNIDQLVCFPSKEHLEALVLDVMEDPSYPLGFQFEDREWQQYLSLLKPFGLNLLLNTDCKHLDSKKPKTEKHFKKRHLNQFQYQNPDKQRCFCQLSRKLGFQDEAYSNFIKILEIFITCSNHDSWNHRDEPFGAPNISIYILKDVRTGSLVAMSEGSPELLLDWCADYWNGQDLILLDDYFKKKLKEFYTNAVVNDADCVLYSFMPLNLKKEQLNQLPSFIYHELDSQTAGGLTKEEDLKCFFSLLAILKQQQTLLSLINCAYQPKEDFREFIEDLRMSGIRFVYFSKYAERESKAFAERLGLETDWNSCILLSSADDEKTSKSIGYREPHDIKAKLPRGIENVRPHIQNVDDIPLHVSLFADCSQESISEMIRIFQENGEVVCCLGNALNAKNISAFSTADLSIAMEPFESKNSLLKNPWSPISIGSSLITLPTSLTMHYETSPYALSQTIIEARTWSINLYQSMAFILGSQMATCLLLLIGNCLFLPPIFIGFEILWLTCFLIPLIGFSIIFTPIPSDYVMKLMPSKNINHFRDLSRYFWYFIGRFLPPVLVSLLTFIIILLPEQPWRSDHATQWMVPGSPQQQTLIRAQNSALFSFLFSLVFISSTFLNRTKAIWEDLPFQNYIWVCCSLLALLFQLGFSLGFLFGLNWDIPTWLICFVFLIPLPMVAWNELIKLHERKNFLRFQKRSKLEFNTKLGCYSPV